MPDSNKLIGQRIGFYEIVSQVADRIDETGHLKVDQRLDLPRGEVLGTVEIVTEDMLAAEDTFWEAAIGRDPQFLDELLAEGLQSIADT